MFDQFGHDFSNAYGISYERFIHLTTFYRTFKKFTAGIGWSVVVNIREILRQRPVRPNRVTIMFQPRWSASRWRSTT